MLSSFGVSVKIDGTHIGTEVAPLLKEFYKDKSVDLSSLFFDPDYAGLMDYVIVAGKERSPMGFFQSLYEPGAKIPSVRELAAEAGVNPNTMQKALSELERSGLVTSIRTSGRVVTEDRNMIAETRNKIAREQIKEFMQRMQELGFEKEDILALLKKETGGENL